MKITLIILLSVATIFKTYAHKSFVSIANMEYNEKTKQIEVSLKLTAHDFEHILEKHFGGTIHIEKYNDTTEIGQFVIKYLADNFKVKSKNKWLKMNYVGKEVNVKDELYFYFTFKKVKKPKEIVVKNTFLFEMFKNQQNIIHYKILDKTKSVTLISTIQEGKLSYNN